MSCKPRQPQHRICLCSKIQVKLLTILFSYGMKWYLDDRTCNCHDLRKQKRTLSPFFKQNSTKYQEAIKHNILHLEIYYSVLKGDVSMTELKSTTRIVLNIGFPLKMVTVLIDQI